MDKTFKIKITMDNQPLAKLKTNNINDLDNIFNDLKRKINGRK